MRCGAKRVAFGIETTFRLVDTCAAEFEAFTPITTHLWG